ncbi:MAG TPA: hypothetical protein PLY96_04670 [Chromatiaceae bacterium]|nr:hypothetical protein [Chromatiaceae bacterium]
MQHRERPETQRRWLAEEAARLMAEQGIAEPERARRKVAERAGIADKRRWPSNEEVQEALLAYRRLFWRPEQTAAVDRQRQQALAAMRHFHRFRPRLIGSLATDYPDPSLPVRLLLAAEAVDEVVLELLNQGIRWRERQETRRFADGSRGFLPVLSFLAGDTPIELLVLPHTARSNPPLDPMDDRPERGLDEVGVTALLTSVHAGQA